MHIAFETYAEVFFDLDGVILDTNPIKKRNIKEAVAFKGIDFRDEFVAYFTANNGVPREVKIASYFEKDEAKRVLENYNRINLSNLHEAAPVCGVIEVFQYLRERGTPIHVFTGGTEEESSELLEKIGLKSYFAGIHGGPLTKNENFDLQIHQKPILMFGDSRSDYKFSVAKKLDFIFVSGFTQFDDWERFFHKRPIVGMIEDFRDLVSRATENK